MHRADNSATGQERSEYCEPKCREDQPHVPGLQHAAFFLHHHGMQKGSAGEPRHQRRVLNRVPGPVASPAEDGIGPVRAKKNSAGEKSPGHHRPAAGDVDPLLARILHRQCAQSKGKRNSESHIAEIKHRRMNHHLGILQQRIQPVSIRRQRSLHDCEWPGGKIEQQ